MERGLANEALDIHQQGGRMPYESREFAVQASHFNPR